MSDMLVLAAVLKKKERESYGSTFDGINKKRREPLGWRATTHCTTPVTQIQKKRNTSEVKI